MLGKSYRHCWGMPHCGDCNALMYNHGFKWVCTVKRYEHWQTGRAWKNDPDGTSLDNRECAGNHSEAEYAKYLKHKYSRAGREA